MLPNASVQHRVKHFDLLLARELSLIHREHSQNLITHQKLERSIRRASDQSSTNNRTRVSIPFNQIYNEQTESIDYQKLASNDHDTDGFYPKRRLSIGASSTHSQNPTSFDQIDDFSDDTSSYNSFRRRRHCMKTQRLPPIVKANISSRQKRDNKSHSWMTNYQQSHLLRENVDEPFAILNKELPKPILPELTPIQRQVRSFLETLPTYKGVQRGFDSFGTASLYSTRAPVVIR